MSQQQTEKAPPPITLKIVAKENLRFIRVTMENATLFTGISGKGYLVAGLSAVVTARLAALQPTSNRWLLVWMIELVFSFATILTLTTFKSQTQGKNLWSGSDRRLLLAFLPTMTVGAILTFTFHLQGLTRLLPGLWLNLYRAAVVTAGLHSIRLIVLMGLLCILIGTLLLLNLMTTDFGLGLGFGLLHIGFGIVIWRKHGG